jgi:hypothetical protein
LYRLLRLADSASRPLGRGALELARSETAPGVPAEDRRQLGLAEVLQGLAIEDKSLLDLLHVDLLWNP